MTSCLIDEEGGNHEVGHVLGIAQKPIHFNNDSKNVFGVERH